VNRFVDHKYDLLDSRGGAHMDKTMTTPNLRAGRVNAGCVSSTLAAAA
jgi:hypothetical protein